MWTTEDQTVAAGHSVDVDPARWQQLLEELVGRVAGRFPRVELRRRARAFVWGLLADLPRKNCWTIAEQVGDASPDGMQHLLGRAVWDQDKVRDDVRGCVVEHLGDPRRCWWWTRPATSRRASNAEVGIRCLMTSVWLCRSTVLSCCEC